MSEAIPNTVRAWTLNGEKVHVAFRPGLRLLDVLRDDLRLVGTKEGCGEGECGACAVVLDGRLVLACLTLAAAIPDGTEILTIEGLERTEIGRALQEAFLASGGVQCGCCAPGMLVASWALLSRNPRPTREEVRIALSGNLCRCTGYATIVDAVIACAGRSEGGS